MPSRAGASVPAWLARRFEGLDDDPATTHLVAAAVATEQVMDLVDEGVKKFHFYTLNRADLVYAICHLLGLAAARSQAAGAAQAGQARSQGKEFYEEDCKHAPRWRRPPTERILIIDGAMGTMIQRHKLRRGRTIAASASRTGSATSRATTTSWC